MDSNKLHKRYIENKLLAYLSKELKNDNLTFKGEIKKIDGGFESTIYHFTLHDGDEKSMILRLYTEHDNPEKVIFDSQVLNALQDVKIPVPKVHFVCSDKTVLGCLFLIMDFIPGKHLMYSHSNFTAQKLGETQAIIHSIDTELFVKSLKQEGHCEIPVYSSLDDIVSFSEKYPEFKEGIDWLIQNNPGLSENQAICHGDFHPFNILVEQNIITGIVDWGGIKIANPVLDIANTCIILKYPIRLMLRKIGQLTDFDWDDFIDNYLSAYRNSNQIKLADLNFYKVRRSLLALIQGYEGQEIWRQPEIVSELKQYIYQITGILLNE